jgi:dTMP kinase
MALLNFSKSKKREKPKGKFIVIDGNDGTGKSTQSELLIKTLKTEGYEVETIHFPQYGNKSAGAVEEYLSGKYGRLNPYAASIFYAIDRFDASATITDWLKEGKVVVCDRYVTANAGHQGGKIVSDFERLKYFKWLNNLEYKIFGIPKPDLNIILHMPAETANELMEERHKKSGAEEKRKDIHEEDLDHLKASENAYLEIAKLFPNTKLVECVEGDELLLPQEIHNKVWELVRRIALKK